MSVRKKVLTFAFAVCFMISILLSGCSSSKVKTTETGESEAISTVATDNTTVAPEPLAEASLIWYFPGGFPMEDQKEVFDAANNIVKSKINATVDFRATNWGEYEQKMQVVMAASEEFDLCFTSNWFNNYLLAVSKGAYQPVDDLLIKYAPNLYASMPQKTWNAVKVGGKMYGILNQQIFARNSNMEMPKKFADKYAFDPNSVNAANFKLEDMESYLEKFKNEEKDGYPVVLTWNTLNQYYGLEALGGDVMPGAIYLKGDSLKVFNQFESEQFKQYLALVEKWSEKGYLKSKDLLTNMSNMDFHKVGVWFGGTWKPGVEAEASQSYGEPMVERAISESYLGSTGVLATMQAISRTSKNPERAMMFMELMNTDVELYNLVVSGIENKDYTKKNDKYIEIPKDSKYNTGTPWLFASTFNAYLLDGQPEDCWEQTKKINDEAAASPSLGFAFDSTVVKTEAANCSAVVKEYIDGLNYGVLTLEKDYPVFIDKLKKAGSDKIIQEMQNQIDTWAKTK